MVLLGYDHRTADEATRREVVLDASARTEALRALRSKGFQEAFLLSTCNRTELLCHGDPGMAQTALGWRRPTVWLEGEQAARRTFRWCSGLESAVLGETEIVAQVKDAWALARETGTANRMVNRTVAAALRAGRRVRAETELCRGVVSYPVLAARVASELIGGFAGRTVIVLGSGEIAHRMVKELQRTPPSCLWVVARNVERGCALACRYGAEFQRLGPQLPQAHVVFGCIVGTYDPGLHQAVRIDLGAPPVFPRADIDLEALIRQAGQNALRRQAAVEQAERIVEEELARGAWRV